MKVRDLKLGEYFTLKPIAEPKESQVFVRDVFDRSSRKYICTKFSDFCSSRLLKPDTEVFTDFVF